jgi:hypothetical protein
MSAWDKYKEKLGTTRPWDALKPENYETAEESQNRWLICEECPRLLKATSQCKECGCFMKLKVKLKEAVCPLGKW